MHINSDLLLKYCWFYGDGMLNLTPAVRYRSFICCDSIDARQMKPAVRFCLNIQEVSISWLVWQLTMKMKSSARSKTILKSLNLLSFMRMSRFYYQLATTLASYFQLPTVSLADNANIQQLKDRFGLSPVTGKREKPCRGFQQFFKCIFLVV